MTRRRNADSDESSFRAFVDDSQRSLLRVAELLTGGDRGRAEDLVQHALVKTYLAWSRVGGGRPEAYARAIIVNAHRDFWRRQIWREKSVASLPETGDGRHHADDAARRLTILNALRCLTTKERTVVVLRYYADLSEADAAQAMGVAIGTVKSTHARALARLLANGHLLAEELPHD